MNPRKATKDLLTRLHEPVLTARQVTHLLAHAVKARIRVRPSYVTFFLKCLETLAITAGSIVFGIVLVVIVHAMGLVALLNTGQSGN